MLVQGADHDAEDDGSVVEHQNRHRSATNMYARTKENIKPEWAPKGAVSDFYS